MAEDNKLFYMQSTFIKSVMCLFTVPNADSTSCEKFLHSEYEALGFGCSNLLLGYQQVIKAVQQFDT